jgi:hypothetical protein
MFKWSFHYLQSNFGPAYTTTRIPPIRYCFQFTTYRHKWRTICCYTSNEVYNKSNIQNIAQSKHNYSLIIKTNKCTNMYCIILKHTLKHLKSSYMFRSTIIICLPAIRTTCISTICCHTSLTKCFTDYFNILHTSVRNYMCSLMMIIDRNM